LAFGARGGLRSTSMPASAKTAPETGWTPLWRAWFQDPTRTGKPRATPGSRAAENWHYDLTVGKRAQAVRLGAVPVTWRDTVAIINRRYEESR
jgi:hypothetical protein